jgi:PAS domain S-box-containing protein
VSAATELRLLALLEASSDIVALADDRGGVIYVNAAVERELGHEPGALVGVSGFELIHPDDIEAARSVLAQTLERPGSTIHFELRLRHKNGAYLAFESAITNMLADPAVGGLIVAARNLTARRLVEQRLEHSEQKFQLIFENTPIGMAILDGEGQILEPNQALCELLGCSKEMLKNRRLADFTCLGADRLSERRADPSGEVLGLERRFVTAAGRVRFLHVAVAAIPGLEPLGRASLAIVEDVTERRELEERRLECANRQRDALVREVHHRIKNNLQGVIGLLGEIALKHPELDVSLKAAIQRVRAVALVHGLQAYPDERSFNLCQLTQEIVRSVANLYGAPIEFVVEGRSGPVQLPPQEMVPIALIVTELLSNAVKHGAPTEDSDSVAVTLFRRPEEAVLVVRNKRGYLPPEIDFGRGLGLGTGLDLAKSLMPVRGAVLTIGNCDGGGVEAVLELKPPVLRSRAADPAAGRESTDGTARPMSRGLGEATGVVGGERDSGWRK